MCACVDQWFCIFIFRSVGGLIDEAMGWESCWIEQVVLNNFGGQETHKLLMAVMFQNMFPPINMQTVRARLCARSRVL